MDCDRIQLGSRFGVNTFGECIEGFQMKQSKGKQAGGKDYYKESNLRNRRGKDTTKKVCFIQRLTDFVRFKN